MAKPVNRLPSSLLDQLRGGDHRSIGRSNAVAQAVLRGPERFPELLAGLWHPDPLVRMRSGDALEKVSREHAEWFRPVRRELLELAQATTEQETRWHLAQILPRLRLRGIQRTTLLTLLRRYRQDESAIVRVCALEGLAVLAALDPALMSTVRREVERALKQGSAAEQARARRLRSRLG